MLKPPFATAAAAILITLAGGPMGLGEVHARAIYTGTFDPSGPAYEWSGTHEFGVDEACLSSNGWKAVNGQSFYDFDTGTTYNSCGSAVLLGGSLTLKDVVANVTETVDFAIALGEGAPPRSAEIWGIYVKNGELAGVDTDLLGPIAFTQPALVGIQQNPLFWYLRWESGWAPTVAYAERSGGFFGYDYVQLQADPVYLSYCNDNGCSPATPDPARDVTFTRLPNPVPEPWSLPLVGAALGALAWTRRRR